MDSSRYRCTVIFPDGVSRRVSGQGLLIGRDPACDIVLRDPAISRRHALIRASFDGVELVPLGRLPVGYNGRPCERAQLLADGDQIEVARLVFTVKVELPPPGRTQVGYRLVRGRSSFALSHTPFVAGGGDTDDLILDRWPAGALRFHLAQGELFVEVMTGAATRNGQPIEADTLTALGIGDVLGYLGDSFEIAGGDRALTTITGDADALPSRVVVEMLPRGGRVVFSLPGGERTVYLADRRLDLIAALVRPPPGYTPGDFIPDEVLRPIVWPRNPNVIRSEINVHITRCRKDLLAAGLAGPRLLQRSPGGGATRLALAPGCTVEFL
ncbi:MAG TPA: FHA domain-containing protein [Kofleriaceae bacterium]